MPTVISLRSVLAAAVLLMAVIIAFRTSAAASELMHALSVHVSLAGQHSPGHVTPKPAVRYVVIPPKVCQP